jgi:hypothetical protein
VLGRHLNIVDAALNGEVAKLLTIREKKYQLPDGIFTKLIAGIVEFGKYGLPDDCIADVPANIRCADVGLENAEYHISAYWIMPTLDAVIDTINNGFVFVGYCEPITGGGIYPKLNGDAKPVLGAGVNCVTLTSLNTVALNSESIRLALTVPSSLNSWVILVILNSLATQP